MPMPVERSSCTYGKRKRNDEQRPRSRRTRAGLRSHFFFRSGRFSPDSGGSFPSFSPPPSFPFPCTSFPSLRSPSPPPAPSPCPDLYLENPPLSLCFFVSLLYTSFKSEYPPRACPLSFSIFVSCSCPLPSFPHFCPRSVRLTRCVFSSCSTSGCVSRTVSR
jgi:hypothetical protein